MKWYVPVLLLVCMSAVTNAQDGNSIAGQYNLGSTSPESASQLFVLDNGTYAIAYFGGVQTGRWESDSENTFRFIPYRRESGFELYGRNNPDLNGQSRVSFNGFENSETFVQLRADDVEDLTLQRVFNSDANCFDYPYVYTFEIVARNVVCASSQQSIFEYDNQEGYNDFIARYISVEDEEAQPFSATLKDGQLYLRDSDPVARIPLDDDDEDIQFIKTMIEQQSSRPTLYVNPWYNEYAGPDNEEESVADIDRFYEFDEQKKAFIDREYYVEGVENTDADESYDDMSILFPYKALKAIKKEESVDFQIREGSLFQVNCD